jgi:hypothetical protein
MQEQEQNTGGESAEKGKTPFWRGFTQWKYFRAALPDLSLAGMFMLAAFWSITVPGMPRKQLGYLMEIEFLVIHSFGFLGFLALAKPTLKGQKVIQWIIFFGLLALYIQFARMAGGLSGVISFFSLGVVTYFGFLLKITSERAKAHLITRWFLSAYIYAITSEIAGSDWSMYKWAESVQAMRFGMLYFAALGLLEWSGFYDSRPIRAIQNFVRNSQKNKTPDPPSGSPPAQPPEVKDKK